jgi:hypothetical protein
VCEGRKIGDKFGGIFIYFLLLVGCEKLEDWGRRRKARGWERAEGITEFEEAASGTLRIRGFSGGGFGNICNEGGSKQFRRFVTKILLAFSSCPA